MKGDLSLPNMTEQDDDDLTYQRSAVYALAELRKEAVIVSRICDGTHVGDRITAQHRRLQRHVHRTGELVSSVLAKTLR